MIEIPVSDNIKKDINWHYLIPSILSLLIIFGIYISTSRYPLGIGGLYNQVIMQFTHFDGLPETIQYYGLDTPFAYPPLGYFVLSLIYSSTDIDPLLLTQIIPAFWLLLIIPCYYWLSAKLLDSTIAAIAAPVFLITNESFLFYYAGSTGILHGFSLFLLVLGINSGYITFKTHRVKWVIVSAIIFGATILTHPTHSLYFGVSYLVIYGIVDRSKKGLLLGSIVALAGFIIAIPWIAFVIQNYGLTPFLASTSSHGGLFTTPVSLFNHTIGVFYTNYDFLGIIGVSISIGLLYLIDKKQILLPALLLVYLVIYPRNWIFLLPAAMIAASGFAFLIDSLSQIDFLHSCKWWDFIRVGLVGIVMIYLTFGGAAYFSFSGPDVGPLEGKAQHLDNELVEASEWAKNNTSTESTFFGYQRSIEWFPYLSERLLLDSLWGSEWRNPGEYQNLSESYTAAQNCNNIECVYAITSERDIQPDYIIIDIGEFSEARKLSLIESVNRNGTSSVSFRNDKYVVISRS